MQRLVAENAPDKSPKEEVGGVIMIDFKQLTFRKLTVMHLRFVSFVAEIETSARSLSVVAAWEREVRSEQWPARRRGRGPPLVCPPADRWTERMKWGGRGKDIFIRIILRHRISSGKVAQCLVNAPTHTGRRPREAGKPTGALPHLSLPQDDPSP